MFIAGVTWALIGTWSTSEFMFGKLSSVKPVALTIWTAISSINPYWYQTALIVIGLSWIAYVASRPDRQEPSQQVELAKSTWFLSQGFYWEVLPHFASQYRLYPPGEAMTHTTLQHIFQGPYCASSKCKMLVGDDLLDGAQTCRRCGEPLRPEREIKAEGPRHGLISAASSDPLWPLTNTAYREAIAALHEGKLMPSHEEDKTTKLESKIGKPR